MDIAQLGKEYGWSIAMLIFILDKVYPQMFSWFTKSQQKKFAKELEEVKAEREDRIAERQFRHEQDARRASLEERQVKAYEELVKSNQLQAQLLITLNERMNTLNTTQNNMSRFLNESIAHMMEVRAAKDKTDK